MIGFILILIAGALSGFGGCAWLVRRRDQRDASQRASKILGIAEQERAIDAKVAEALLRDRGHFDGPATADKANAMLAEDA